MAPSDTLNLHDILSARHFALVDHNSDIDVPTVAVNPAVTSQPLPTDDDDATKSGTHEQDMNPSRGFRKAGRPRLDKAGGAVLSEVCITYYILTLCYHLYCLLFTSIHT